jgi:hypothetical protein
MHCIFKRDLPPLSQTSVQVSVNVRHCRLGEVLGDTGDVCVRCDAGFFSVVPDDAKAACQARGIRAYLHAMLGMHHSPIPLCIRKASRQPAKKPRFDFCLRLETI